MAERPSNIAAEAVWPTRAQSRQREHVVAGTGGVTILKSEVPIPPEPEPEPEEHIERRVYPPTPDTRDQRPSTRAGGADALGRNKGGKR
jgi:hypothetical protein